MPNHAERVLGLSANLDDDGTVPLIFFDTVAHPPVNLSLTNYEGQVEAHHRTLRKLGRTNLHLGIDAVVDHYRTSGTTHPAYVATMLDGRPDSPAAVRRALCDASTLPMVWDLHGWGDHTDFLRELDNLPDDKRAVDNVELLEVGPNPRAITDTHLYEHMTGVLSRYLTAARSRGIIR
ncbi:VWA domain-containing protein [Streptomyces sp. NBC_01262]|uniref:VWA domain-containing protein n=1 Tax=Streptomyces sp. NBC_01262 TaxID=2903803 RepID=UPI003FCDE7B3